MNKKRTEEPEEERTYRNIYYCDNCGRNFPQDFQFGERAKQGACPFCGVAPRERENEAIM